MPDRSNAEIIEDYESALGTEFGAGFREIENRYTELRLFWRLYRSFFGANEERVTLLNRISGVTAWALEHALLDQCILKLSRLLDPARTGRDRENLSFERISDHIVDLSPTNADEFQSLLENAKEAASAVRDWRNRNAAHLDLEVAHNRAVLTPLSRREIDLAIEACGELINWVLENYFDSSSSLDPHLSISDDELVFLKMLYLGQTTWDDQHERFLWSLENSESEPRRIEFPDWLSETYDNLRTRLSGDS